MSMEDHKPRVIPTSHVVSRSAEGIFRLLFMAVLMAVLLCVGFTYYNGWHTEFVVGYIFVGAILAVFLRLSHQVWKITVKPFITVSARWIVLFTKIPFWYMAGGIGYTIGQLIAKKFGILDVVDRPVNSLFGFGVKFAVTLQLIQAAFNYRNKNRERVSQ